MVVPDVFHNKEYIESYSICGVVLQRGLKMNTHGTYHTCGFKELEDSVAQLILHPPNPLATLRDIDNVGEKEAEFLDVFQDIEAILEDIRGPNEWSLLHPHGPHPTINLCHNLFRVKEQGSPPRRSSRLNTSKDWIFRPDLQEEVDRVLETYALNPLPVFDKDMNPYPPVFLQSRLPDVTVEVDFDVCRIMYPPPESYPPGSSGRMSTLGSGYWNEKVITQDECMECTTQYSWSRPLHGDQSLTSLGK
ncbi:hypothetical protein CVT24_012189 [Panaeolus cyanescens]|uniref:Uncharacterized protein n=1 Tax=Panaeolus cyanescens TaxID=181874 RepID=A0A409W4D1_9AGAR|nr:hypothetical protein CVT24_012189 [Panaeolus cyanescens]